MGVATELSGFSSFPRNLSVWWNEETEYVLQRIERWAGYARGYNRLRSVRLSPGRLTMHDEPADNNRWSINQSTNRLVVENSWAPNFRHPRRQQQPQQQQQQQQAMVHGQPAAERTRLRGCCPFSNVAGYKSNANLDKNCLEAYSLDHSIYFKTVGEVRREAARLLDSEGNEMMSVNNFQSSTSYSSSFSSLGNASSLASPTSLPLDCGDFLASDFDDLDGEGELSEFEDAREAYELREQLSRELEADAYYDATTGATGRPDVIQVCRSAINEDEINNNFTRIGLPRQLILPPPPLGMLQRAQ